MSDSIFVEDRGIIFAQPEWNANDIKWLWSDDYYDGPLAGMIEYHGQKYYAVWTDTFGNVEIANREIYCVYKLTEKRTLYQEAWYRIGQMGIEGPDYNPLDLKTGRDGEIVGWFVY